MSASFRPTSWFPFWADFMWPPGSHSSSMGTPEFRSFHWPQLCSTNGCLAATFTVQSVFKENSVPRSYWKAKNENVSLWNMFQIQVSYLSADVLVTFLIAATKYLKKSPEKGFTLAQHRGSSGFRSVSHWSHSSQVAEGGCLLSPFYSVQSPTLRTGPLTSTNLTQE